MRTSAIHEPETCFLRSVETNLLEAAGDLVRAETRQAVDVGRRNEFSIVTQTLRYSGLPSANV